MSIMFFSLSLIQFRSSFDPLSMESDLFETIAKVKRYYVLCVASSKKKIHIHRAQILSAHVPCKWRSLFLKCISCLDFKIFEDLCLPNIFLLTQNSKTFDNSNLLKIIHRKHIQCILFDLQRGKMLGNNINS